MHHQAGRLVNDAQMLVFEHHVDHHRFRAKGLALRGRTQLDLAGIPGADSRRSLGHRPPLQRHQTAVDHLLQIAARELWYQRGQSSIEPLPVFVDANRKGAQLARLSDVGQIAQLVCIAALLCRRYAGEINGGVGRYN